MYSSNYYPEGDHSSLPDNYDGTVFGDEMQIESKESSQKEDYAEASSTLPLLGSIFGRGTLPFLDGIRMPNIGTEELLIIAVAAFLLFSKNGDRECALILLFLLFVN